MKNKLWLLVIMLMPAFVHAQKIAGGGNCSFFICTDGTPQGFGDNSRGQLGVPKTGTNRLPIQVDTLTHVTEIASSEGNHTMLLKSNGTVWACGWNGVGQFGDSTIVDKTSPVQITRLSGITHVATGYAHSLFIKSDSTVWACGYNDYGQLGDSSNNNKIIPVQVKHLTGITAIAGGEAHSLFLKKDTVFSCGYNNYGQCGPSFAFVSYLPVPMAIKNVTAIAAGFVHSLFLKSDSTVWACGNNGYGTLGDSTGTDQTTPVQVKGLTGIIAIAAADYHSVFLKSDGTVWACGWNNTGQLGDSTTTNRWNPVQVYGLTNIVAIAAGSGGNGHTLFLRNDGTVWGCGTNINWQLGDGTIVPQRLAPVQAVGLCAGTNTVNEISAPLNISVTPTLFDNEFTINGTSENALATVYDLNCRRILQQKAANGTTMVSTNNIAPGFYILNYRNGSKTKNIKLVKL